MIIIDVREPNEYKREHVDGAINIPLSGLTSRVNEFNQIDKSTQIIVYCASGARSSSAVSFLKQLGFSNVVNGINVKTVNKALSK